MARKHRQRPFPIIKPMLVVVPEGEVEAAGGVESSEVDLGGLTRSGMIDPSIVL